MRSFVLAFCVLFTFAAGAQARDAIHVVGPDLALPYANSVAQTFNATSRRLAPKFEEMDTATSLAKLCAGRGEQFPDIALATRRITPDEYATCAKAGVKLIEVLYGSAGIVIANSTRSPRLNFTLDEMFKLFGAQTVIGGKVAENPYKTWKDIDSGLPISGNIEIFGPPDGSGIVAALKQSVMAKGAANVPELKELRALDSGQARMKMQAWGAPIECQAAASMGGTAAFACITEEIRSDGAWVNAGHNAYAVAYTLSQVPSAVGVFSYAFVNENADLLHAATVDGVAPTELTIASGEYPIAGNQYFYVSERHFDAVPGLEDFAKEFASDRAIGKNGYIVKQGLMPIPGDTRSAMQNRIKRLTTLTSACVKDRTKCDW